MLKDGEEANIQFLDDDPYSFMAHQLQIENRWKTIPCQLEKQRHCTLCDDGSKPIWRAAFRVLDSRGAWDKDKGKFKYDAPVERLWMVNATVANQIKVKHDKKGTLLTNVWTVTRSGSGKHDTSYNIERAVDDNDVPMKAVKHTPVMQDAEDILVPPSDKGLQGMGYSSRKANSAPAKKRKVEEDADID